MTAPHDRDLDPSSGDPAHVPSARAASPDEEALEILFRLVDRVQVARSFARLCAGVVQAHAARASEVMLASDLGRVARVAAQVLVETVTHAGDRDRDDDEGSDGDAVEDEGAASASFDHETWHDDAC